jgi:hypothetical protein
MKKLPFFCNEGAINFMKEEFQNHQSSNFHLFMCDKETKLSTYLPAARERKSFHDISPFLSVIPIESPIAGITTALDEVPCTTRLKNRIIMNCSDVW